VHPTPRAGLTNDLGRTRKENLNLKGIFKQNYNINVLSISRCGVCMRVLCVCACVDIYASDSHTTEGG